MKSGRSEDPLYVSTVLVKGSPPRGRARRGKPDRATETRNGNTGFTSRQLPSYVTVPLLVAADALGISGTTLKRLCRQHGIKRWPYRRIVGIDRTIRQLESRLVSSRAKTEEDIARVKDEINDLRHRRRAAIDRFNQETSFLAAAEKLAAAGNVGATISSPPSPCASHDDLATQGMPGTPNGGCLASLSSPSRARSSVTNAADIPAMVPTRSASTSPAAVPVSTALPTSIQGFKHETSSLMGAGDLPPAKLEPILVSSPDRRSLCNDFSTGVLGMPGTGRLASLSSPSRRSSSITSSALPATVPARSASTSPAAVPVPVNPTTTGAPRGTPKAPPPDQRYPPPSITLPRLAALDQSDISSSTFTEGTFAVCQPPVSRAQDPIFTPLEIQAGAEDGVVLQCKIEQALSPTAMQSAVSNGTTPMTADDAWLPDASPPTSSGQSTTVEGEGGIGALRDAANTHEGISSLQSLDGDDVAEARSHVTDMTVEDFQVLHELLVGGGDSHGDRTSFELRLRDSEYARGRYGVDVTDILYASAR